MRYAYGVDVGGTSIKIGFFTEDGKLELSWEVPTRIENDGESIVGDIMTSIENHLSKEKRVRDDIVGIGVGLPGPIENKAIVNGCVNLGWGRKNIKKEMEELSTFKVYVENDANIAALGEVWQGGGKGYKNSIMVTLGTGVGGGIIIDGKIYGGSVGAAGEIGHMPVNDKETEVCGCGKKGCLEQYVSANGILRMAKKYLEEHPEEKTKLLQEELSTKTIFDEAKAGDKVALLQIEEAGRRIGKALATVTCVLNPEVVIIGGGVSKAGQVLTDVIEKYYKHYAFHASKDIPICLALLDNKAGMYGAAKLVFDA
ncbi:MAG: ROK family glucokinase [Anaerostipes sp.]|nr:ROK family glucokinase [Anaerostipes sp.]